MAASGEWSLIEALTDNLAIYIFGDYMMLGLALTAVFIILLTGMGVSFVRSLAFSIPLLAGFALAGWFGDYTIIFYIGLIIIAFPYSWAIIKLTN